MKGRVFIISEVFYPEIGSGANRMTNMTLKLKEYGYNVDILTSTPKYPNAEIYKDKKFWNSEKEEKLQDGSNIYRISPSKIKLTHHFFRRLYIYLYFLIKCLLKLLSIKGKYDIVIATEPSIFMGILGIVSKYKFKSKFILDIRDLWPECLKNLSLFKKSKSILKLGYCLESIILKFTDSLIINSDGFREYLLKKGYKKDIIFVPNGLTEDDREKNLHILKNVKKNNKFTVVYTGMLGIPQNVRTIVKVARNLRKYNDIKFLIIGTGIQKDKVVELINHYKLSNIELIDAMPKLQVLEQVAKSHIALAHLRGDSVFDIVIPGKIIDYMSIGIPIVAGVEGYTATIIEESCSGIVTSPDNHREMAKKIEKIYFNKELQKVYSQNGLDFSTKNFNWDYNILKVDMLIKKLLRGDQSEANEDRDVCMESLYQ